MAVHTIYFPDLRPVPGGIITVTGEEAHHALRVKRLGANDAVRLCNGKGLIAQARLVDSRKRRDEWELDVDVMTVNKEPVPQPRLTVLAAPPKGDRLEAMIDSLSQVGASGYAPLETERTIVEPRQGKLDRLSRVAIEAMKQCGRAWTLEIADGVPFEAALARKGRIVLADASGKPYRATGADDITILIGPEGGWTQAELASARAATVEVARFGTYTMRTETAAIVAAALVMESPPPTA
jgi:16S rRNA (uracil1498-N3)-methyltransferase